MRTAMFWCSLNPAILLSLASSACKIAICTKRIAAVFVHGICKAPFREGAAFARSNTHAGVCMTSSLDPDATSTDEPKLPRNKVICPSCRSSGTGPA